MALPSIDTPSTSRRFLFYSHDGLGLGHTRRNLAIAAALVELCPGASILLATGTDETHRLGLPPRVEVLKLPGLRKAANEDYQPRRLPGGRDEIRHLRASLLEAAVGAFRPDVVLVDKHPFGARGEFRVGLELARAQGGRVALGLRDILDDPEVVREEWARHGLPDRIAGFHDRILIYGERAVFDPTLAYALPESISAMTVFCGYVVNRDAPADAPWPSGRWARPVRQRTRPLVLATTGGGEDGFALLENFIAAAERASWRGIAIAGPLTPEPELAQLRRQAEAAEVVLQPFVPRLSAWFASAGALVCMGGYNTLSEAALHAVPTVCVPRVQPRTEQLIRAQAFARLGLTSVLHPDELNPGMLHDRVNEALSLSRLGLRQRVDRSLHLDGARSAAQELLALADEVAVTGSGLLETPLT